MRVFAIEDMYQKARQEAIKRISVGSLLRMSVEDRDGDLAIHVRSPRGPKGASLGFVPALYAEAIAESIRAEHPVFAKAMAQARVNELEQLVIAVTDEPIEISLVDQAAIEDALADAPRLPVVEPRAYPVGLVGESNYQANIQLTRSGEDAYLWREPDNPHDGEAIAVTNSRGKMLGYIPRDSFVQRLVHVEGRGIDARVLSINGGGNRSLGVVIEVTLDGDDVPERAYVSASADHHEDRNEREARQRPLSDIPMAIWVVAGLALLAIIGQCSGQ